jgi:hypothetical protein
MRLTPLTPIAAAALGVPATLLGFLPSWCLIVLVGASVTLTAIPVVVSQIIRLRASGKITRSQDALRVLEIEDLPHRGRQPRRPLGSPGPGCH